MADPLFVSAEEWIDHVRRALGRPGALHLLSESGLGPERVLAVARVEATLAGPDGISRLSHYDLAELSGVRLADVRLVRLFLIDLGLQSLSPTALALGGSVRLLHHV
jgi:hypothetical protein